MIATCRYGLLFLSLLLTGAPLLFAQLPQYRLLRIQEQDGLRTGEVVGLAKDRKGFLWVCTQLAAQRFDGRQTSRFSFTETITHILADAQDRIWVLTRDGVHVFNADRQEFNAVPLPANSGAPTALFQLRGGPVNLFAGKKRYHFDEKQGRFLAAENTAVGATRFLGEAGAFLFSGDADSIFVHDKAWRRRQAIYVGNYYQTLPLTETDLLVSTRQFATFFLHLPSGRQSPTALLPVLGTDKLVAYAQVPLTPTTRLLGTTQGLLQLNLASKTISRPRFFYDGQPLDNQPPVETLLRDGEGNVFVNLADGLFLFHPQRQFVHHLRNYRFGTETLPGNSVRDFAEDDSGRIWMATTNGLSRLNPQTGELKNLRFSPGADAPDFPSFRQVLYQNGGLWVGTSGIGVWRHRPGGEGFLQPKLITTDAALDSAFRHLYLWQLLPLRNGDVLAVGGTAVYRITANAREARLLFRNPAGVTSRAGVHDAAGRFWQGTTAGLFCFDSAFRPLFRLRDSFPDKRVAAFCEWTTGRMLIGSRGLYEAVVKDGKPVGFERKRGVPAEAFVYCMAKDAQGAVWLGTDDGLYRYDPQRDAAVHFDGADGVQTQAFNSDGAFISGNGTLYMGGRNGVNYLNPAAYASQKETLQPQVLHFRSGDSLLTVAASPHRISYHNRSVDFLISVPEFRRPFRLQYRYRLTDGGEWTSNGTANRVRIGSLAPGDYRLRVAASLNGQDWFDGRETIAFTVLKPWWQTTLFRLAVLAALVLAVWRFAVYRKQKRQQKELQQTMDYFTYAGAAGTSVQAIVWDIARSCIARLGFEDCVIYLLDEKRQVLLQKAALGAKSITTFEIVDPIEIPVGRGITGAAAAEKGTVVVGDTSKDSRYIEDDARRYSEIAVPIVHEGQLLGVIDSEHRRKNFFTLHHRRTLETIASLCAAKLATALVTERIRKAEAELQALNTQMREATFTNLRLQMNPHFLFNTLTTIQYLIVSNQVDKASRYLDIFAGFLRSLLNHAEDTVVTLEEELRILKLYVELESLCLDETFVWTITVDEKIEAEDVLVPFMLLQPFVENAINHGLVHKVGEKRFSITVTEREDDCFECLIEDNGIGRSASAAINEKKLRAHLHESKGLQIVRQRLHLLQQKTGKQAACEMEDLIRDGAPAGTLVRLLIPYYQTSDV